MVVTCGALVHHRERQAGVDAAAVDDHRAGAALAVVAALLGAGEVQVLAQRVEQRRARVELQCMPLPFTSSETLATGTPRVAPAVCASASGDTVTAPAVVAPAINKSRRDIFKSRSSMSPLPVLLELGSAVAAKSNSATI